MIFFPFSSLVCMLQMQFSSYIIHPKQVTDRLILQITSHWSASLGGCLEIHEEMNVCYSAPLIRKRGFRAVVTNICQSLVNVCLTNTIDCRPVQILKSVNVEGWSAVSLIIYLALIHYLIAVALITIYVFSKRQRVFVTVFFRRVLVLTNVHYCRICNFLDHSYDMLERSLVPFLFAFSFEYML